MTSHASSMYGYIMSFSKENTNLAEFVNLNVELVLVRSCVGYIRCEIMFTISIQSKENASTHNFGRSLTM